MNNQAHQTRSYSLARRHRSPSNLSVRTSPMFALASCKPCCWCNSLCQYRPNILIRSNNRNHRSTRNPDLLNRPCCLDNPSSLLHNTSLLLFSNNSFHLRTLIGCCCSSTRFHNNNPIPRSISSRLPGQPDKLFGSGIPSSRFGCTSLHCCPRSNQYLPGRSHRLDNSSSQAHNMIHPICSFLWRCIASRCRNPSSQAHNNNSMPCSNRNLCVRDNPFQLRNSSSPSCSTSCNRSIHNLIARRNSPVYRISSILDHNNTAQDCSIHSRCRYRLNN